MTLLRTDALMKKLLVALFASAFAFGSVSALGAGSSMKSSTDSSIKKTAPDADISIQPLRALDTDQMQAARAKAKDHWAKMTREEQAAAMKAARAKKQGEFTALDEVANRGFWTRWLDLPWRMPPERTSPAQRQ
jgi:hypothetical protein